MNKIVMVDTRDKNCGEISQEMAQETMGLRIEELNYHSGMVIMICVEKEKIEKSQLAAAISRWRIS